MALKLVLFGHHINTVTGEPVYILKATKLNARSLEYLASEITELLTSVGVVGSEAQAVGLREAHVLELQARVGALHQCARDMRAWLERETK